MTVCYSTHGKLMQPIFTLKKFKLMTHYKSSMKHTHMPFIWINLPHSVLFYMFMHFADSFQNELSASCHISLKYYSMNWRTRTLSCVDNRIVTFCYFNFDAIFYVIEFILKFLQLSQYHLFLCFFLLMQDLIKDSTSHLVVMSVFSLLSLRSFQCFWFSLLWYW